MIRVICSFIIGSILLSQLPLLWAPQVAQAAAGDKLDPAFKAEMEALNRDPNVFAVGDRVNTLNKQQWQEMIQGWKDNILPDKSNRSTVFTYNFHQYYDKGPSNVMFRLDVEYANGRLSGDYLDTFHDMFKFVNEAQAEFTPDQVNQMNAYLADLKNRGNAVKRTLLVLYFLINACLEVGCNHDLSWPINLNPGANTTIWRPNNFFEYISGVNGDRTIKYSNVEQFWGDIKALEGILDSIRDSNNQLKPNMTPNTVSAALQNVNSLLSGKDTPYDPYASNDPCGNFDVRRPGEMISIAFCGLVDVFHTFAVELLLGSAYFLAEMVPINNQKNIGEQGNSGNDSALGGFLTAAIPQELKAQYLPSTLRQSFVSRISASMINVISVLMIIMFIMVALSNILQLNINSYAIKKIIPGMIIGYLAAYFGVFAMRAGLEIASYATNILVSPRNQTGELLKADSQMDIELYVNALGNLENTPSGVTRNVTLKSDPTATGPDIGLVFKQGILNIFIFAAAILMFIVAFLLVIRSIIFLILTPLAPLAIFSAFVPPIKFIWDAWIKTAMGWMFMNVIIALYLWIGMEFFIAANTRTSGFNGLLTGIIGYSMGLATLFMAMQTPFKFAGKAEDILKKYSAGGKALWGKTGGTGLKAAGKHIGNFAEEKSFGMRRWANNLAPAEFFRDRRIRYNKGREDRTKIMKVLKDEGFDLIQGRKMATDLETKLIELEGALDEGEQKKIQSEIDKILNSKAYRTNMKSAGRKIEFHHDDHLTDVARNVVEQQKELSLVMGDDHEAHHYRDAILQTAMFETGAKMSTARVKVGNRADVYGLKYDARGNKREAMPDDWQDYDLSKNQAYADYNRARVMNMGVGLAALREEYEQKEAAKQDRFVSQSIVSHYGAIEPNWKMQDPFGIPGLHKEGPGATDRRLFEMNREMYKIARTRMDVDIKSSAANAPALIKPWDHEWYEMILEGKIPDETDFDQNKSGRDAAVDLAATYRDLNRGNQYNAVENAAKQFMVLAQYGHLQQDAVDALQNILAIRNGEGLAPVADDAQGRDIVEKDGKKFRILSTSEKDVRDAVDQFVIGTADGQRLRQIWETPHKMDYNPNFAKEQGQEENDANLNYSTDPHFKPGRDNPDT